MLRWNTPGTCAGKHNYLKMVHSGFVAVHLGAGKHSFKKELHYKKLCSTTCEKGVLLLSEGKSALEVACHVMTILEDSALTNAGYGSNLNEDGEVECDAGLMISNKSTNSIQFGAVSGSKHIKNPILIAKEIIDYQNEPRLLGRTPPCLLVGEGVSQFARKRGLSLVENSSLISDSAMKMYRKIKMRIEECQMNVTQNDKASDLSLIPGGFAMNGFQVHFQAEPEFSQDTIGVVCIDTNGNIASAGSSGGIALKLPGRSGQVSMFGCGCWAQHSKSKCGVAVTTSGCGEQLIMTTLAKTIGENVLKEEEGGGSQAAFCLKESMTDYFINSDILTADAHDVMGGVLVAYYDQRSVDFNFAFTTDSMAVGFMATSQEKATVRVARSSTSCTSSSPKSRLTMEGFVVNL